MIVHDCFADIDTTNAQLFNFGQPYTTRVRVLCAARTVRVHRWESQMPHTEASFTFDISAHTQVGRSATAEWQPSRNHAVQPVTGSGRTPRTIQPAVRAAIAAVHDPIRTKLLTTFAGRRSWDGRTWRPGTATRSIFPASLSNRQQLG